MNFGERLKEIRERKGLTMQDMADKIGITRQGYARYESQNGSPTIDNVYKIADALGVEISTLLPPGAHGTKERIIHNLTKLSRDYEAYKLQVRLTGLMSASARLEPGTGVDDSLILMYNGKRAKIRRKDVFKILADNEVQLMLAIEKYFESHPDLIMDTPDND